MGEGLDQLAQQSPSFYHHVMPTQCLPALLRTNGDYLIRARNKGPGFIIDYLKNGAVLSRHILVDGPSATPVYLDPGYKFADVSTLCTFYKSNVTPLSIESGGRLRLVA